MVGAGGNGISFFMLTEQAVLSEQFIEAVPTDDNAMLRQFLFEHVVKRQTANARYALAHFFYPLNDHCLLQLFIARAPALIVVCLTCLTKQSAKLFQSCGRIVLLHL